MTASASALVAGFRATRFSPLGVRGEASGVGEKPLSRAASDFGESQSSRRAVVEDTYDATTH